ncbi:hypothetical protein ACFQ60_47535 [Streptomyces zhihengii]
MLDALTDVHVPASDHLRTRQAKWPDALVIEAIEMYYADQDNRGKRPHFNEVIEVQGRQVPLGRILYRISAGIRSESPVIAEALQRVANIEISYTRRKFERWSDRDVIAALDRYHASSGHMNRLPNYDVHVEVSGRQVPLGRLISKIRSGERKNVSEDLQSKLTRLLPVAGGVESAVGASGAVPGLSLATTARTWPTEGGAHLYAVMEDVRGATAWSGPLLKPIP